MNQTTTPREVALALERAAQVGTLGDAVENDPAARDLALNLLALAGRHRRKWHVHKAEIPQGPTERFAHPASED